MIEAAIKNPSVAEIKARRARLGYSGTPKTKMRKTACVAEIKPKKRIYHDRWDLNTEPYNHHVTAWKFYIMRPAFSAVLQYTRHRAKSFGLTYEQIIGPGRKRPVTLARQIIIWEIKRRVKPGISYPDLGRRFGDRDHTTILHAVRKIDKMGHAEAIAMFDRMEG